MHGDGDVTSSFTAENLEEHESILSKTIGEVDKDTLNFETKDLNETFEQTAERLLNKKDALSLDSLDNLSDNNSDFSTGSDSSKGSAQQDGSHLL